MIFLTVFLDLVGFGIFITLSPFLARYFDASALEIGLLMSCYSVMQFLFAPFWGRLSDRIGRRPVLLVSIFGGSLSYLALAFSPSLAWMFVCRSLAGLFAANISTAHAYIADITSEKDRASGMGLIGAAFGLGFIVGPSLGSLFGYIGHQLGEAPPFGIFFASLMAFVITALNGAWAYWALPETNHQSHQAQNRWAWLTQAKESRILPYLIVVFFIANFSMPLMEVMLFPFVGDRFQWGFVESGIGFAIVGLMMAFTQGVLVRRLLPKWGERKLLMVGTVLMAVAFYMISTAHSIVWLAFAMTFLAIGNGFVRPSLLAMMSLLAGRQQGAVMGASQSAASLGRILGPVAGGWLYSRISMGSPFFAAGCFTVLGLFVLIMKYRLLPDQRSAENV